MTRPGSIRCHFSPAFHAGLSALFCAGALGAVGAVSVPPAAAGALVSPMLYVANNNAYTVTSYPTSAKGDTKPSGTLANPYANTSLSGPLTSAFDPAGDLWVPNSYTNTLVEYKPGQLARGGSPAPAVTISARNHSLDNPSALAFNSVGDLWVANGSNNTLVEYKPGQLARGGSRAPAVTISASKGSLNFPFALTFNAAGDLWVANLSNRLVEYAPRQLGKSGSPAPAASISARNNSLNNPSALAFNSAGDLWVANLSGRPVDISAPNKSRSSELAFNGADDLTGANLSGSLVEYTPRQLGKSGSPAPAVSIAARNNGLNNPSALAFNSAGDLWVANLTNQLIEFAPRQLAAGSPTPEVTLSAKAGSSLDAPYGLAFDKSGDLWATNNTSNALVEYKPRQLGGGGSPTPAVILSSTDPAIDGPEGVALNASGDLWVANAVSNTVAEYTPSQLARSGSPAAAVTISANKGSLSGPAYVDFDASGNLWVANADSNTLVEYTASELAAGGSPKPAVTISASNASLDNPSALAFDASGELWVANGNTNTLVEFKPGQLGKSGSPRPAVTVSTGTGKLNSVDGLAFDASGSLWVAKREGNKLIEYTPRQLGVSGSPAPAVTISGPATRLNGPVGLALDPSGDLWVANGTSSTLIEYTPRQLGVSGSPAPAVTISGPATGLNQPWGIAIKATAAVRVAGPGGLATVPYYQAK